MALHRQQSHHEGEGEGYLVSVSDLMIGLLFVFLLMLMAFVSQYRQSEQNLRAETSAAQAERLQTRTERDQIAVERDRLRAERDHLEAERDRLTAELKSRRDQVATALASEIDRVEAQMRDAEMQRQRLLLRLEGRLREAGVPVQIDPGSGVLRLPDGVLFRPMSADLSDTPGGSRPSARETVRRLAAALAEVVPCYAAHAPPTCSEGSAVLEAVFIEGHTDKQKIARGARYADNYELSTARALTTYRSLLSDQPGLALLQNSDGQRLFGLSGYGEDRPIDPGDADEDLAVNRRIDLRFVLALPPVRDLQMLRERVRGIREGR